MLPGRLGLRFALEALFLVLLAIGAGLADLRPALIVLVVAAGWLLVVLVELTAERMTRSPLGYVLPQPAEPEDEEQESERVFWPAPHERTVVAPPEPPADALPAVEEHTEAEAQEPAPEPEPAAAPEPERLSEPEPEPETEPEPEPEPVAEAEPEAADEPEPEVQPLPMTAEEAEEPPVAPKRRLGLFRRREPQAEEPPPPAPPRHVRLLPRRPAEEEEEPSAAEQEVAELFGAGGSPADEREDGQP